MALDDVRRSLAQKYDPKLVDELLAAYVEAKTSYYLGGLRLSEVEGGRFCEAAFRLLQQETNQEVDRLGKQLDTQKIIADLETLPATSHPDSVRIHIPRALRLVYDIRNKRDAAHLADGIDPNLQDATLVISVLDWVLAEFVRLHHAVTANEAQTIVEELVTRQVPAIQEFNGFPKVLRPELEASEYVLLLLYHRRNGATLAELESWVRPPMRPNLRRTVTRLVNDKAYVHLTGTKYVITYKGASEVERRKLFEPS